MPAASPTAAFIATARALVAGDVHDRRSSKQIAARASAAVERLSRHLARLVGETGNSAVLRRSVLLAAKSVTWLVPATTGTEPPWVQLRRAMEGQEPDVAIEGFVCVLSTFIDLLGKFIGHDLVARLLHEIWPELFRSEEEAM